MNAGVSVAGFCSCLIGNCWRVVVVGVGRLFGVVASLLAVGLLAVELVLVGVVDAGLLAVVLVFCLVLLASMRLLM